MELLLDTINFLQINDNRFDSHPLNLTSYIVLHISLYATLRPIPASGNVIMLLYKCYEVYIFTEVFKGLE